MADGYKMLHAGGDGSSNGLGIIVNVEISKEVVQVERWQGRIIAIWMMIRQQLVCVNCVYGPQIGRTEAEEEAFREEVDRLAGLSDGQMMMCVAGDFNAHIGVVAPGDEENVGRFGWGTMNREGRELVEMLRRNGLTIAGTFFQKKESHKITYRSGRYNTELDLLYWWCGHNSSGGCRTAKLWRESMSPHSTNRSSLTSA